MLSLALIIGGSTHPAGSQLPYDHTSFVAGFGSNPGIWTVPYADIGVTPPDYLARTIVLDNVGYAPVSDSLTYPQLVGRLSGYLSLGGQHVLVAHSLGSLVSRGTYINYPGLRPNIAGIIAVAAPHQGAPLADNAVAAVNFFVDVQRRVNDGLRAANVTFQILSLLSTPSPGAHAFFATIASLVLWKTAGQDVDLGNVVDIPKVPALPDLSPSSSAIQMLNQRTDDAAIPRANIYGTIPFQNAAFRLKYSNDDKDADFRGAVTDRNWAVVIFKACKYFGYATIVLGGQARRCAYAAKVLQRVDERWTGYVNGRDGNGRPRYVPFDGIVPNERSRYPSPNGVSFEARVDGVDHQNIYKTRAGLDQVSTAMGRIGMVTVNGTGNIGGVTISGPTDTQPRMTSTYSAGVSGGVTPFQYSWTVGGDASGSSSGSSIDVTAGSSDFGMTLVVTDAAGHSATGYYNVTVGGCGTALTC